MHPLLTLEHAFSRAAEISEDQRALVAVIWDGTVGWWGGHVAHWHLDEDVFASSESLTKYRKLLESFLQGDVENVHVVLVYRNGTFASVILGAVSLEEARELLKDTQAAIRKRVLH